MKRIGNQSLVVGRVTGRLEREVALKVLPAAFVAEYERLARFAREAPLLATLTHPDVAAIYGCEESGARRGSRYRVRPDCQLRTTFRVEGSLPAMTVLIRKRWPSGVTSQYQLFTVAPPPRIVV